MIKVALIQSPQLKNKQRGVGVYTTNLHRELKHIEDLDVQVAQFPKLPEEADIYHYTYFDPFFMTLKIAPGTKNVVTVHDLIPIKFPRHFPKGIRGSVNWLRQKNNLRKANALITDSVCSKRDIAQLTKISSSRIYSIYLAPDPRFSHKLTDSKLRQLRQKYDLPEDFILYVGDVNWNKNIVQVAKSIEASRLPSVIVSQAFTDPINNNHKELEEAYAAQKILKNLTNCRMLSKVSTDDLTGIYRLAKVLLFPSRYEGFGLPVVEAFASGCPVICTKNGSLHEVAGEGVFYVLEDDTNTISTMLKKFYTDNTLRKKYQNLGFKELKRFSWQKTVEQTYQVYKELVRS